MPKIINKKEKKAEILDAAIRMFAKKGAAGTKIQDIAEEAGIGKGTIYLYYKNKEEIFQDILHQKVFSSEDYLQKVLSGTDTPADKLKQLLLHFASDLENHNYPLEIQLEILAALIRSPGKHHLVKEVIHLRDIISGLIRDIQQDTAQKYDSQALASGLLSFIHGIMILWLIDKKEFPIQHVTQNTLNVLIETLSKSS
jgi:TetR/AcrR family fatty acid metabolism transcriptional regulator